jgi:ubiquinone/menaquinone biosynthesis C-methylase UbiE
MTRPTLSHAESISFYDSFGAKQDKQGWYEDAAIDELIEHAEFGSARSICEFGCGTGKLAEHLLTTPGVTIDHYLALDSSPVMVRLASHRLSQQPAADVQLTNGVIAIPSPVERYDRLVTCYVLDLLSESDANTLLAEARRVLKPGGLLCVVSLSHGKGPISKLVSGAWSSIHRIRPSLVGGCRPISFADTLYPADWDIRHQEVVAPWGVPSEIIIAAAMGSPAD